jgi:hypothetical protein
LVDCVRAKQVKSVIAEIAMRVNAITSSFGPYLEIKHLPRLGLFARHVSFHLLHEFLLGQLLCFVQPGCTVEFLPAPTRDFR